jgi:5'-nucleotidase (lipoprotein e(P4) family)
MKNTFTYFLLSTLLISGACSSPGSENHQDQLLQSTIWFQHSAEMKAIYIQTYNLARRELARKVDQGGERPLAVVLDIDETVLDNSPQTSWQILDDQTFSDGMWDDWCALEAAEPLPGSLDFTLAAKQWGVEVFYISNRGIHLLNETLNNLKNQGFPFADSSHVLLKQETSSKDARREWAREHFDIALMIGDNLGDFDGVFDQRLNGHDHLEVDRQRDLFGSSFFLLPNPIYGGWEKPYRGESPRATYLNKLEALKRISKSGS